jgi:hypothetical protein
MQPYFLPYIGYFQLMAAVDKFVVYDDVNFIKGGWINRNRILLNGASYTFTLPLHQASPNKLICEIERHDSQRWCEGILRTIHHAYSRAPNYDKVSVLLEKILSYPAILLSEFVVNSLREIARYLSLEVDIVNTSRQYQNVVLKGQERIFDICLQEGADCYINPIGGIEIYSEDVFQSKNIKLEFIRSKSFQYQQLGNEFISHLSIIDVMMFNSIEVIREELSNGFDLDVANHRYDYNAAS